MPRPTRLGMHFNCCVYDLQTDQKSGSCRYIYLEIRINAKSTACYDQVFGQLTSLTGVACVITYATLVRGRCEPRDGGQLCSTGTAAEASSTSTGGMTW